MGKHGPNSLENYQAVHDKRIRQALDGGFLVFDGLRFDAYGDSLIVLEGNLECLDGLAIEVLKEIRIVNGSGPTARVQSESYSYNAMIRGLGNVFRYDSPHDHRPHHHVHRYNVLAGDKEGTIIEIYDENERPTLGEVLDELRDWYYENYDSVRAALGDRRG